MTTESVIQEIVKLVKDKHESEIIFSQPVTIKLSPHTYPVYIFGVHVKGNSVWLATKNGITEDDWYELEATDRNAWEVATSILQRVKWLTNERIKSEGSTVDK